LSVKQFSRQQWRARIETAICSLDSPPSA